VDVYAFWFAGLALAVAVGAAVGAHVALSEGNRLHRDVEWLKAREMGRTSESAELWDDLHDEAETRRRAALQLGARIDRMAERVGALEITARLHSRAINHQ